MISYAFTMHIPFLVLECLPRSLNPSKNCNINDKYQLIINKKTPINYNIYGDFGDFRGDFGRFRAIVLPGTLGITLPDLCITLVMPLALFL